MNYFTFKDGVLNVDDVSVFEIEKWLVYTDLLILS